jgi:hypothetical protein
MAGIISNPKGAVLARAKANAIAFTLKELGYAHKPIVQVSNTWLDDYFSMAKAF